MKRIALTTVLRLLELPKKIEGRIKKKLLLESFQQVGVNVALDPLTSVFPADGTTRIGNNVFIGKNAYFGGDIRIGNNVMLGPNVTLAAGNHIFAVRGKSPRFIKPALGENSEPIVIEDEVWIGAGVVILGNVTVGLGSVVGAGSVVVNDVCPFTVAVGNPCRPVRRIFDNHTVLLHMQELGYSDGFAAEIVARREIALAGSEITLVDNTDKYASAIYDV